MNINGKYVTLRAIELEDQEMLVQMFNDGEIESLVCGFAYPTSNYQQSKWFEAYKNSSESLRLIIETEDYRAIGYISLTDIDWKNRSAVLGGIKLINDDIKGRGYGTDSVFSMMRYAFEELNLNRIEATVLEHNGASRRVFEKCGFIVEGMNRKSIFKQNSYHNVIRYGVLKEEYETLIKRNNQWEI